MSKYNWTVYDNGTIHSHIWDTTIVKQTLHIPIPSAEPALDESKTTTSQEFQTTVVCVVTFQFLWLWPEMMVMLA